MLTSNQSTFDVKNKHNEMEMSKKVVESQQVSSKEYSLEKSEKRPFKMEIVWRNVFGMLIIHIGAAFGLYFGVTGVGDHRHFVYMWIVNFLGAFSILAGAHRLWCHRSYKAKWPLRFLLMIFQTMAMQNDIYEWCRDHRVHHKYSETDADPHNSNR
jgi:stearoyl-CoA desaturase (delta-9 desaturase)